MTHLTPNNTTGLLMALEEGSEEFLAPLLGPDYRHERAGVVRPGIMRLRKYPDSQKLLFEKDLATYKDLVSQELTWDEIDKRLGKLTITRGGKQEEVDKLIPMNVDYFTLNRGDCVNPANADRIKELYADSDGKVRSFPVWFATNDWWNLIPHSLRCYGTSGLKHKSSFIPVTEAGKIVSCEMVCESPSPVEKGKRIFGGRDWIQHPCVPEDCPEFQAKQCTFGGSIQCMIPGVKGIGVWIVPTTSWFSMKSVKNTLSNIWKATGGRIAHLLYEDETIFMLRKVRGRVPVTDGEGKTTMKEQWLINLDVTVDPLELVRRFSSPGVLVRGAAALAALSGGTDVESQGTPLRVMTQAMGISDRTGEATAIEMPRGSMAEKTEEPRESVEAPKVSEKKEGRKESTGTSSPGDRDTLTKQKTAIKTQAMRLGCIAEDRVDKRISAIASSEEAAAIIFQLNKGNYSAFVTYDEALEDLRRAVGKYGLTAVQTEPVISALQTAEEAFDCLMRLTRGDLSQFLSTDDGGDEEY